MLYLLVQAEGRKLLRIDYNLKLSAKPKDKIYIIIGFHSVEMISTQKYDCILSKAKGTTNGNATLFRVNNHVYSWKKFKKRCWSFFVKVRSIARLSKYLCWENNLLLELEQL